MATIAENLQIIKDSTDAIKQAIIDKGGAIEGDITTWASAIGGIQTGEDNVLGYDAVIINKNTVGLRNVKEIHIHDGITSIGDYAFWNHNYTEVFTIPDSIVSVGRNAFDNCALIRAFVFPEKCNTIGTYAFNRCYKLETITFNGNISKINNYTFASCSVLSTILFNGNTSVPQLTNTNALSSVPVTCKIVVPDALYDTWIAATNWSTYASYIIKKSDYEAL